MAIRTDAKKLCLESMIFQRRKRFSKRPLGRGSGLVQDMLTEIQHLRQMLADANEEKAIQADVGFAGKCIKHVSQVFGSLDWLTNILERCRIALCGGPRAT